MLLSFLYRRHSEFFLLLLLLWTEEKKVMMIAAGFPHAKERGAGEGGEVVEMVDSLFFSPLPTATSLD